MVTILLAIGLLAVFFVFLSIRLIFIKDGHFRGTCASKGPFLDKIGGSCPTCGTNLAAGGSCKKEEQKIKVKRFFTKLQG